MLSLFISRTRYSIPVSFSCPLRLCFLCPSGWPPLLWIRCLHGPRRHSILSHPFLVLEYVSFLVAPSQLYLGIFLNDVFQYHFVVDTMKDFHESTTYSPPIVLFAQEPTTKVLEIVSFSTSLLFIVVARKHVLVSHLAHSFSSSMRNQASRSPKVEREGRKKGGVPRFVLRWQSGRSMSTFVVNGRLRRRSGLETRGWTLTVAFMFFKTHRAGKRVKERSE